MKLDFLKLSNSRSILLITGKKTRLQKGYIKLKGKIRHPDCQTISEPSVESIG